MANWEGYEKNGNMSEKIPLFCTVLVFFQFQQVPERFSIL